MYNSVTAMEKFEIYSEPITALDNVILSTREYDMLEPILQEVNGNYVRFEDDIQRRNVACLEACKEFMIKKMKEANQTFSNLYQDINHTGSFYEGSRVRDPNEFDLNFILKKPFEMAILEDNNTYPGFVQLEVTKPVVQTSQNREQCKWLKNDLVSAEAVIRWWEGVVAKVFELHGAAGGTIILHDTYSIKIRSKSGPAITLCIKYKNSSSSREEIDVDLVPVFVFKYPIWPKRTRTMPPSCKESTEWCVTPKIPKNGNSPTNWRLSFAFHEKEIIHDKPNLKNIYRFMKRLRDCSVNLKCLKSYYIKTLFLWKAEQLDAATWRKSLGRLFIMFLFELENCLKNENIPFFWDKRMNLIEELNPTLRRDMYGKISNIKKKICRLLNENDTQQLQNYMHNLFSTATPQMEIIDSDLRNLKIAPDEPESSSWSCVVS